MNYEPKWIPPEILKGLDWTNGFNIWFRSDKLLLNPKHQFERTGKKQNQQDYSYLTVHKSLFSQIYSPTINNKNKMCFVIHLK